MGFDITAPQPKRAHHPALFLGNNSDAPSKKPSGSVSPHTIKATTRLIRKQKQTTAKLKETLEHQRCTPTFHPTDSSLLGWLFVTFSKPLRRTQKSAKFTTEGQPNEKTHQNVKCSKHNYTPTMFQTYYTPGMCTAPKERTSYTQNQRVLVLSAKAHTRETNVHYYTYITCSSLTTSSATSIMEVHSSLRLNCDRSASSRDARNDLQSEPGA